VGQHRKQTKNMVLAGWLVGKFPYTAQPEGFKNLIV
jgi:hypothetical protein